MAGGAALTRPPHARRYLRAVRFLHTADWHLGQTLLGRSRRPEHVAALDWLFETCVAREVDGLIVAGDVFDVASPAEDARKLYYDFLARIGRSAVRWVVVVAGNHDSARMLSNVDAFARHFDIRIVCTPGRDRADDLVPIRSARTGDVEAVVAAAPFLHEGFVRRSLAGESHADKGAALAAGIHAHFDRLDAACAKTWPGVPRIATGHLYASGASAREGQDNIYVGNVRNLDAARLPAGFDYVALGHIHRPQSLRGAEHVRYAGSLIPLDFAESADGKGVWQVEFDGTPRPPRVEWVGLPSTRRLKQFRGTSEEVAASLRAFGQRHAGDALPPWAEVRLRRDFADQKTRERLREVAEEAGVEILKFTRERMSASGQRAAPDPAIERLDELSVEEVFDRRLAASDLGAEASRRVRELFAGALADARAQQSPGADA